ncbi:MAG: GxxExxY protein [Prevotella sp.]|nr:GxxExxY protein [Prevotella sp.]
MTENDISYLVRGAIFKVYNTLGPGLLESVYEEALLYQLQKDGCIVDRQIAVPIIYDGITLKSDLRIDLLVNKKVIIELKSVAEMKEVFFKQTRTYLKLTGHKLGILVNFSSDDIDKNIHRIVNGI